MTERPPALHDLVDDLTPEEEERLGRVHELLVAAGPPAPAFPGTPPRPSRVPGRRPLPVIRRLPPPRRVAALAALAAVVLVGVFAAGYAIGDRGPQVFRSVPMTGANGVLVTLDVLEADDAGNWPMDVRARGLAPDVLYEVWLTRRGELAEQCGAFKVGPDGTAHVPLNAPFRLRGFDGWVVVRAGSTSPVATT